MALGSAATKDRWPDIMKSCSCSFSSRPNQAVMCQLLKLELSGRRVYVESLRGDVASKTSEVWNAYPCFKSVVEVCSHWLCKDVNLIKLTRIYDFT